MARLLWPDDVPVPVPVPVLAYRRVVVALPLGGLAEEESHNLWLLVEACETRRRTLKGGIVPEVLCGAVRSILVYDCVRVRVRHACWNA
jgi:hypothetical protein